MPFQFSPEKTAIFVIGLAAISWLFKRIQKSPQCVRVPKPPSSPVERANHHDWNNGHVIETTYSITDD